MDVKHRAVYYENIATCLFTAQNNLGGAFSAERVCEAYRNMINPQREITAPVNAALVKTLRVSQKDFRELLAWGQLLDRQARRKDHQTVVVDSDCIPK
jgi:hypothetical protein